MKTAAQQLSLGKDESPEANTPLTEYMSAIHTLLIREKENGRLIMLKDGAKVLQLARGKIFIQLHQAHSGIGKMFKTACQLYYWPNMKSTQMIANYQTYQTDRQTNSSKNTDQGTSLTECTAPMQQVATDLFDSNGQKWLVLADRFLGCAWLEQLNKTPQST